MSDLQIVKVNAYSLESESLDLRAINRTLVLHQRAFGPRQLLVATARADRTVLCLAHCDRTDPPEKALGYCLAGLGEEADLVVAYQDEPVTVDPPSDLQERFAAASEVAATFEVRLVDWFMCDDMGFRSTWSTLYEGAQWWETPRNSCSRPRRPSQ